MEAFRLRSFLPTLATLTSFSTWPVTGFRGRPILALVVIGTLSFGLDNCEGPLSAGVLAFDLIALGSIVSTN